MKILFIGGTGTISTAISKKLLEAGEELYILNRGSRNDILPGAQVIKADINNEAEAKAAIEAAVGDTVFDVVCDFICFVKSQAERDFRIFKDRCRQFMFISSASAYQKPVGNYIITESTPLYNPYWKYSRDKIEIEEYLISQYREAGFPITIIRPSHTYDERNIPLGVHGDKGSYQVVKRMLEGKPVIIHGDGTSLWTMTHNSDFAVGFIGLMNNPKAIGEAFHITSDESLTWNEIYSDIAAVLGIKLNAVHISSEVLVKYSDYDFTGSLIGDKANSVVFDNSKVKRLVPEFTMKMPFYKGVKQTIDYVLTHSECQIPDPEFDAWCDKIIADKT
ncbi:MAG: SDR family oxidoreductase [Ruminococcus sp.]|jgi:nucleoside-diphosphate-sugar epimerase|nr:SDR family oxidoreductase [Ruminococcus sp.]